MVRTWTGGQASMATASRGMALCLLPPSMLMTSNLAAGLGLAEHTGQELDGVAAPLVDVEPGMAAAEAVDVKLIEVLRGRFLPLERQDQGRIGPAGAADGERPLVLAVEVEEHLAR